MKCINYEVHVYSFRKLINLYCQKEETVMDISETTPVAEILRSCKKMDF